MRNACIIASMATLFVTTSCKEVEERPERILLSEIESLYDAGLYSQTLDSIMALRERYPAAESEQEQAHAIWQEAALHMAQDDIARTDSFLSETSHRLDIVEMLHTQSSEGERRMLRSRRDSLQERFNAMCAVVRMIHVRQNQALRRASYAGK